MIVKFRITILLSFSSCLTHVVFLSALFSFTTLFLSEVGVCEVIQQNPDVRNDLNYFQSLYSTLKNFHWNLLRSAAGSRLITHLHLFSQDENNGTDTSETFFVWERKRNDNTSAATHVLFWVKFEVKLFLSILLFFGTNLTSTEILDRMSEAPRFIRPTDENWFRSVVFITQV